LGTLIWNSIIGTNINTNTISFISSSPSIGYDGSIFVGSNNGKLYAFNNNTIPIPPIPVSGGYQLGSPWPHLGGLNNFNIRRSTNVGGLTYSNTPHTNIDSSNGYISSPVIDACGNVYSITTLLGPNVNSYLYKLIYGDVSQNLIHTFTNEIVLSTPAINSNGDLYICSFDSSFSYIYNIRSTGYFNWKQQIGIGKFVFSSPSIDSCGNIYIINSNNSSEINLYSLTSDGSFNINFNGGKSFDLSGSSLSSTVLDSCGNIYFTNNSNNNNVLISITPYGSLNTNFNNPNGCIGISGTLLSTPSIDSCGNIYILSVSESESESESEYSSCSLYSITPDGSFNIKFNDGKSYDVSGNSFSSSIAIDSKNNIYFSVYVDASKNSTLYSITSDGSLNTDFSGGYININGVNTTYSTPAIDNSNNIFLNSSDQSFNNIFYAYDSHGTLIFDQSFNTIGQQPLFFISSPAIDVNRTYFGGNDGILYEFKSK
jgi:hypothetical protein